MAPRPVSPSSELSDDEYDKIVGLHKPGSITRAHFKNFLTYEDAEFEPNPRLNMIVGANGTGKSSILCAFTLGLGGNPKDLGRADDARHFIMHDKDVAEIEIELEPFEGEPVHVFKRKIDKHKGGQNGRGASTFYINDEKVTAKAVKELVTKKYHISVDNLCQFLPQDRVGSFSGFGPEELLIETEKSMSGNGQLYETHQALIEMEADLKKGGSEVETFQAKLKRLEADNERLEREKERMEEREEAERQLELLNSKFLWLTYDALREAAKNLKTDKDEAKAKLKAEQEKLQPLEESHALLASNKKRHDTRAKTLDTNLKRAMREQEKQQEKFTKHEEEMDDAVNGLEFIDTLIRKNQDELARARKNVAKLEAVDLPPEDQIEAAHQEAVNEQKEIRPAFEKAKRELVRSHAAYKELHEERGRKMNKLGKVNDEKAQRKQKIFNSFPELGKICEWLDNNKTKFRRPVRGPIACEITTKSNNAAAFLEFHVPNYTLKSFVVENKGDYDLLYQEVRRGLNIPINILLVENGVLKQVDRPYSASKMRTLKEEHGVTGYLDESFTAADPILQALRNAASVHSVLVGDATTQASIDKKGLLDFLIQPEAGRQAPKKFSIFASKGSRSFRYQGNLSRYSGKMAMSQDELRPPRLLTPGVNPDYKKKLEDEVKGLNEELLEKERERDELRARKDDIEKQYQEARSRLQHVKDTRTTVAKHHQSLERARAKVSTLEENVNSDVGDEKAKFVRKIQAHMKSIVTALESHADQQDKIMQLTFSQAGVKLNQDTTTIAMHKIGQSLDEAKKGYKEAEEQVARISRDFNTKKAAMREAKALAEKEAPIEDEDGNPLPLKEKLEALTVSTLAETEAAMEEAHAKVDGIDANPDVIRQYEERKKEIEEVRGQLSELTDSKESKLADLRRKRAPWEQALDNAVNKVNAKFSGYMQDLDCAGEVRLAKGKGDDRRRGDDDDTEDTGNFKDWGIEIRVKFREASKLQALSARVQSGGERSVSTIMYLMALQDLMSSPTRAVDEINQGLDERNERLVFERIVANSTRPPNPNNLRDHSGQYFLITPKLLPNLFAMEVEAMTILNIFNGPCAPPRWNVDEFIQAALMDEDDDASEEEGDENSSASRMNAGSGRARKQRRLS